MKSLFSSLLLITAFLLLCTFSFGQSKNWYDEKRTSDKPYSINTDEVYGNFLKGKKGQQVVVAVIDSGVDIEHEDLDDVIWTNFNEIPDNGIDDDKNGYIDDIHGWNFIGGKDGSQVGSETLEMTRIYGQLREKYKDRDSSTLSKKELEEYKLFKEYGKQVDKQYKSAKEQYEQFENEVVILEPVVDYLDEISQYRAVDEELLDSLSEIEFRNPAIAANILNYFLTEIGEIPSIQDIRAQLIEPNVAAMDHYGPIWKYRYNPDYDSRKEIVGDDPNNVHERDYGNNSLEGPDAMHGTHVSGIIAAERNNDIGINGISNNTRIMVLRAVPDGDERDKDVANAIRYAVENGASIINMSFGKGQSPNKQAVDDAVRYAEKHDVLMVHAAGNSGAQLEVSDNFPNDHFLKPKGFLFWKKKQPENWISVGASGPSKKEDMAASFSNYGSQDVDVFAPGVMMYSTVPDNAYEIAQGTSMAAPVISGVAALIRSYFPTLTAVQVKEVLVESTIPIETLVTKPGSSELVAFSTLSVSGGIIDIANAVALAARTKGKKKIKKAKMAERA
ncbi:MAG: cell wall-associated protease [Saprospiraceae bacterium]|jgi:cell wall-associated protease